MNPTYRTNTNFDRRRTFRKVPEKFAFIQLERDDGGAVLNVSEGGLSFNTFAPVEQNGPIHFWFSLNLNERIDAWGEVTWTDETKKLGGLRFIRLPERAERQIREWISMPIPRQPPDERHAPQAIGGRPSRVAPKVQDAVARFVSKARSQRAPVLSTNEDFRVSNTPPPALGEIDETAGFVPKPRPQRSPILSSGILSGGEDSVDSDVSLPAVGETATTGELVPMQRYRSAKRRQLILGLLLGTCLSATVALSAIKYWNYRRESRGPRTVSSVSAPQKSDLQASTAVTPPIANRPSVDVFSSGNSKKSAAEAHGQKVLATETGGHPIPNAGEASASNPPERASLQLQPSLSSKASEKKASATPQQLWASVQAGNTKAAVALAELYIQGDGVPQNCNQARVLLLVASEKRNAEAIKRLAELDKTGCPSN
jgi:PilZ domain-containing protein